jgi:hypothetical protein
MRLPRTVAGTILLAVVVASSCVETSSVASVADLALHYAPVIYQDTDDSDTEADFITEFDYDRDYAGANNWDNLDSFRSSLHAAVYYSVVIAPHHWYITYSFFHPRDWTDDVDSEHENDLEGALAIVARGGTYGRLEAMLTVYHLDFYSWTPNGSSATNGDEDIDGDLPIQDVNGVPHPALAIQAEGHGVKAFGETGNFDGSEGQDGVIYTPASSPDRADTLPGPPSADIKSAQYRLIDVFPTLWAAQMYEARAASGPTFDHFGTFDGNDTDEDSCGDGIPVCNEDAANSPWGWDDHNDGSVYSGELALDPAHVAQVYFDGIAIDLSYRTNQYIWDLRNAGYDSDDLPEGWPDDLDIADLFTKI